MPDLKQIQKDFQDYLLHRTPLIKAEVIGTAKVPVTTRLEIYHDAYYLRLLEALQEDFPVLHTLIGCDNFNKIGHDYIVKHPSPFRSLRYFGKDLSAFIRALKPYKDQVWQAELAAFEWALIDAFDAADDKTITIDEMGAVPLEKWATMCFRLHPSLSRLNFRWNVVELWEKAKKHKRGIKPKRIAIEEASWIIWRKEFATQFCSLPVDRAYMFDAMRQGMDFGSICAGLCEWIDEVNVAMHAAALLKGFIVDGLVTNVIVS